MVDVVPCSAGSKTTALALVALAEIHKQGCYCVVAETPQPVGIQMLETPSHAYLTTWMGTARKSTTGMRDAGSEQVTVSEPGMVQSGLTTLALSVTVQIHTTNTAVDQAM